MALSSWPELDAELGICMDPAHQLGDLLRPETRSIPLDTPQRPTWFVNANIWTGNRALPRAEAFKISADGRILAVGSMALFRNGSQPGDIVQDLGGRYVVPGLVDAHVHFIPAGMTLSYVNLQRATSKEEIVAAVAAAHAKLPPGQWLMGGLWNENKWGGLPYPHKSWIDEITGDRPAFLTRMDGHLGLANSAALRLANITADTPSPEGGVIDKDDNGEPTGIVREWSALGLITHIVPEPTPQERTAAMQAAGRYALSRGVTTVMDMGRGPFADTPSTWRDMDEVYMPAADAGMLPIRVYAFVPLPSWERLASKMVAEGRQHPAGRLYWGGLKEFLDGSLGSRTALMYEPYTDDDSSVGTRVNDLQDIYKNVRAADAAGLQITIHAIGDRAIDEVLDIYQRATAANGNPNAFRRHRVEHAQHLSGPAAAAAFAQQGIYAIANPLHYLPDRAMLDKCLGPQRAGTSHSYAFAALHRAGAPMAFGSDWPVVDLEMMNTFAAATLRCMPGSNETEAGAQDQMPAEDVLYAQTSEAARAGFLEHELGALKPGLRADFVVLSSSPLASSCAEAAPEVLSTYMDGKCAYGCDAE